MDVQGVARLEQEINGESERLFREAGVTPELDGRKIKPFRPLLDGGARAHGPRSCRRNRASGGRSRRPPKTDAAMRALLDDGDPVVATLAAVQAEQEGASYQKLARLATLSSMARATGGRSSPSIWHYFGCHTGRLPGGGGFNIQNLRSRGAGRAEVRGLLIPLARATNSSSANFVADRGANHGLVRQ